MKNKFKEKIAKLLFKIFRRWVVIKWLKCRIKSVNENDFILFEIWILDQKVFCWRVETYFDGGIKHLYEEKKGGEK